MIEYKADMGDRPHACRGRVTTRQPSRLCYLGDDDGRQVFEVLDMGQERISQCIVGIRWKLVEGRLDLHLHCLSGEITRFHILFELQQLVWDLPGIHLRGTGSDVTGPDTAANEVSLGQIRDKQGAHTQQSSHSVQTHIACTNTHRVHISSTREFVSQYERTHCGSKFRTLHLDKRPRHTSDVCWRQYVLAGHIVENLREISLSCLFQMLKWHISCTVWSKCFNISQKGGDINQRSLNAPLKKWTELNHQTLLEQFH